MKLNQWFIAALAWAQFTTIAFAGNEAATNNDAEIEILKQEIQELDQKVRVLARERELDQEANAGATKTAPTISVGLGGFTASSADSNFVFSLKGVIQVDSRTFFHDSAIKNNDGFILRRARPIFQGTLYRDFDFKFMPDFGGSSVPRFSTRMEITVMHRGRNYARANSKRRKVWNNCRRT